MSTAVVSVEPVSGAVRAFNVAARDSRGASRYRVTLAEAEAARWARLESDPARIVEATMRFLLDREPLESVLHTFDIAVVRRYFPEFDDTFPAYLAAPRETDKGE